MKLTSILILALLFAGSLHAQDTVEVNQKAGKNLFASYHVLKKNTDIKAGRYLLMNNKNRAIASGTYDNNKKTGIWRFFDAEGKAQQVFDYTGDTLKYEAPDDFTKTRYVFDKEVTEKDIATKPVRIGGRYFGYMPYLSLFIKSHTFDDIPYDKTQVVMELLISPGGRLADFVFHTSDGIYNDAEDLHINLDAMSDEDKRFVPATINREPVSCRIFILCKMENAKTIKL